VSSEVVTEAKVGSSYSARMNLFVRVVFLLVMLVFVRFLFSVFLSLDWNMESSSPFGSLNFGWKINASEERIIMQARMLAEMFMIVGNELLLFSSFGL